MIPIEQVAKSIPIGRATLRIYTNRPELIPHVVKRWRNVYITNPVQFLNKLKRIRPDWFKFK